VADLIINEFFGETRVDRELRSILEPESYFGPQDWLRYYAINFEPELPIPLSNLKKILDADCPFTFGKKIKETHFLFCLPPEIDGRYFNLRNWYALYAATKQPHFSNDGPGKDPWWFKEHFSIIRSGDCSWFLMYKGVVPIKEPSGLTFKNTLEGAILNLPDYYKLPHANECAAMHFLTFIKNDERNNEFVMGTVIDKGPTGDNVSVGRFGKIGLSVRELPAHNLFVLRSLVTF
jgi:hypothetical protein